MGGRGRRLGRGTLASLLRPYPPHNSFVANVLQCSARRLVRRPPAALLQHPAAPTRRLSLFSSHAICPRCAAALTAEIDARPLRNETNLTQLVLNAPEITNPLVGYHRKCAPSRCLTQGHFTKWQNQAAVLLEARAQRVTARASGGPSPCEPPRAVQLRTDSGHPMFPPSAFHPPSDAVRSPLPIPSTPPPAVLPGLWPSWALQPGVQIDTSDTINKVDRLKLTAQGPTQVGALLLASPAAH